MCGFKLPWHFKEIEELIPTTEVTPAQVAQHLLKSDETDVSLHQFYAHKKRKENEDGKAKKATEKLIELVSEAGQDGQTRDQD
ncbi:hypothetical protein AgCh_006214 [Apium graveolens]